MKDKKEKSWWWYYILVTPPGKNCFQTFLILGKNSGFFLYPGKYTNFPVVFSRYPETPLCTQWANFIDRYTFQEASHPHLRLAGKFLNFPIVLSRYPENTATFPLFFPVIRKILEPPSRVLSRYPENTTVFSRSFFPSDRQLFWCFLPSIFSRYSEKTQVFSRLPGKK